MIAGTHNIRQGEEGCQRVFRIPRAGDFDESGVGKGHTDVFALATVRVPIPERTAMYTLRRVPSPTIGAGTITVRERRDDEVTWLQVSYVSADSLDDANELMANTADLMRINPAIVPEV
jgi:hypothetical protein